MLSGWLSYLRSVKHTWNVVGLAVIHFCVFAPNLLTAPTGALYAHVPFDFELSYHRTAVYISDCLRNGEFPLWYPYGSAGMPLFVNPQTQMWSPVTWIVSLVFGYSHHVAQRQLIFTLLVGGLGAYFLANELWQTHRGAFFSGTCFMLTGAVFTNLEHWDIVNAYALMPWLFYSIVKIGEQTYSGIPRLAFVSLLLITAGYPGVVLMLVLWAGAAAFYVLLVRVPADRRRAYVICLGIAGGMALLLTAGLWLPVGLNLSRFTRGAGLSIDEALSGSIGFSHLLGLFVPFNVHTVWPGFSQDPSMTGLYVGVLALPLLMLTLSRVSNGLSTVLVGSAVLALLLGTGQFFFGRVVLNMLAPFLNLSRFPAADSRAVGALMIALLLAGAAPALTNDLERARGILLRGFSLTLLAVPSVVILLKLTLLSELSAAKFNDHVVGPAIVQMLLLATGLVVCRESNEQSRLLIGLAVVFALDMGNGVRAGYFMVGHQVDEASYRERMQFYSNRFDPRAADKPRIVGDGPAQPSANIGYTAKVFTIEDYSPFRLATYMSLIQRGFLDWMATGKRVVALPENTRDITPEMLSSEEAQVLFRISKYTCNHVDYEISVPKDSLLVFNEMHFPGWKATVNGHTEKMVQVAGGLRALKVGAGTQRVQTVFEPRSFTYGAVLTAVGWLLLLFWSATPLRRRLLPQTFLKLPANLDRQSNSP